MGVFENRPRTARPKYVADRPVGGAFLGGNGDPPIPPSPNGCDNLKSFPRPPA